MQWLHESLRDEVSELHENNVSLNAIGRTDALSPTIQLALEHALEQTKDNPVSSSTWRSTTGAAVN